MSSIQRIPIRAGWLAAKDLAVITGGYVWFLFSGRCIESIYQRCIRLHCMTSGHSTDLLAIALRRPRLRLESTDGILGALDESRMQDIQERLHRDGFIVVPNALSDQICDELLHASLSDEGAVRKMDRQSSESVSESRRFRREAPEGVRFDCSRDALLNNTTIQNLICDPGLLSIAQRYLGTAPILDIIAMWWHSAFGHEPDSEAAQYFHFDMDRIKWIKFFFYVTDVNENSGPHVFVRGSHRTDGVQKDLLRKGYVRLSDQEVEDRYPRSDIVEFVGKRGTLIIEDTRGLHKGKRVISGDRLLFQLEFTSSLFGAPYEKWTLPRQMTPTLALAYKRFPRIFSIFKPC